jgi:hypothetical protein
MILNIQEFLNTVPGSWVLTLLTIGSVIIAGLVLRWTMPIRSTPLPDQAVELQPTVAPRQSELVEMEA